MKTATCKIRQKRKWQNENFKRCVSLDTDMAGIRTHNWQDYEWENKCFLLFQLNVQSNSVRARFLADDTFSFFSQRDSNPHRWYTAQPIHIAQSIKVCKCLTKAEGCSRKILNSPSKLTPTIQLNILLMNTNILAPVELLNTREIL